MTEMLSPLKKSLNLPFLISLAILAIIWEIVGRTADILTLPPVSAVLASLWKLLASGVIVAPLLDSTMALITGLLTSLVAGNIIGISIGMSKVCEVAFGPFVKAGLSAPMIAFVPVFMMLFGIGPETRIATVIAFSVFVVATNAATAVRSADPLLLQMAYSFGANNRQLLSDIRLPSGAPYFLAGLRLGTARGIKGLINGEVLIAVMGLGGLVKKYGTVFSMEALYAIILFILIYAAIAIGTVGGLGRIMFRQSRHPVRNVGFQVSKNS